MKRIISLIQEGKVAEAETLKLKLEQAQRERRQASEESGRFFVPKWFQKVMHNEDDLSSHNSSRSKADEWEFKGDYWKVREDPGFATIKEGPESTDDTFLKLW